jgi:hypothetical protein
MNYFQPPDVRTIPSQEEIDTFPPVHSPDQQRILCLLTEAGQDMTDLKNNWPVAYPGARDQRVKYTSLIQHLIKKGLVMSVGRGRHSGIGRPMTLYALTPLGRRVKTYVLSQWFQPVKDKDNR